MLICFRVFPISRSAYSYSLKQTDTRDQPFNSFSVRRHPLQVRPDGDLLLHDVLHDGHDHALLLHLHPLLPGQCGRGRRRDHLLLLLPALLVLGGLGGESAFEREALLGKNFFHPNCDQRPNEAELLPLDI